MDWDLVEIDLFWNNLLLLGFDVIKENDKHKIQFSKDLFKVSGNLKAMEVIIYFLLYKIDPVSTKNVSFSSFI